MILVITGTVNLGQLWAKFTLGRWSKKIVKQCMFSMHVRFKRSEKGARILGPRRMLRVSMFLSLWKDL